MKVIGLCLLGVLTFSRITGAASPTVDNIVSVQRAGTKLVDIYYDSHDPHGDNVDISVVVKVDDTPITTENFHGDIGKNLRPGTDKHIIWDAGSDWNKEISSQVTFEITVDDGMGEAPPAGMVFVPGGTNGVWVQSLYMDATEITKAKWDEVRTWANTNGYATDGYTYAIVAGSGKAPNHPVHSIDLLAVRSWCNARSEMEGRKPVYYSGANVYGTNPARPPLESVNPNAGGFRPPTYNEFVYAARGGLSGKLFPNGDTISHAAANFEPSSSDPLNTGSTSGFHPLYKTGAVPYTSPVASFSSNGYGLYDMAGNVREWSHQARSGSYFYTLGGSWTDPSGYLKVDDATTSTHYEEEENYIGFRCMCR